MTLVKVLIIELSAMLEIWTGHEESSPVFELSFPGKLTISVRARKISIKHKIFLKVFQTFLSMDRRHM